MKDGEHAVLLKCFAGCDPKEILDELRIRRAVGEQSDRKPDGGIVKVMYPLMFSPG